MLNGPLSIATGAQLLPMPLAALPAVAVDLVAADATDGAGRAIESLDPSVVNQPIVQTVLLSLFIIYLASKTGGEITNRLGLTSILGELLGGGDRRYLLSGVGGIARGRDYRQRLIAAAIH